MAKPAITEAQFDELERNIRDSVDYQFRQVTDQHLSLNGQVKLADFLNDLINEETDEA